MDERLKKIIDESDNIVFFGGAGVSTESNIPDFRSEKGLYKAKTEYGMSPEEMISHSFFVNHTETFFDYYKKNLIILHKVALFSIYFRNNAIYCGFHLIHHLHGFYTAQNISLFNKVSNFSLFPFHIRVKNSKKR